VMSSKWNLKERQLETFSNQMGHSRKHPYHPHGGNGKLTPNTFTIIRNNFSPLLLRTAEISSVGGSMDLFWNDPML
jgi:hypothetical protein